MEAAAATSRIGTVTDVVSASRGTFKTVGARDGAAGAYMDVFTVFSKVPVYGRRSRPR
jgi:hypothetical protein